MQDNYQPQPQAQLQTHVQKQEQKEVDSLKDELSRLNIKQLRLFGKDLNGLGLNELRLLEHQLNEGLLAIKDMKVLEYKSSTHDEIVTSASTKVKINPMKARQPLMEHFLDSIFVSLYDISVFGRDIDTAIASMIQRVVEQLNEEDDSYEKTKSKYIVTVG
ncbi:agamous-like MADS-box protein AGL15 [Nicotiana sylvestris]|uniref:agamous-like MADS-box protein AGL15 n=1 Tax=Nicotiana sylvestris TaxID=4096 RepID=UPI00388C73A2